jgi:hypothetical protein
MAAGSQRIVGRSVQPSPTKVTAKFNIPPEAQIGYWDIILTTKDDYSKIMYDQVLLQSGDSKIN